MKYTVILIALLTAGCSSLSGYYEADPLFKQQSDLLEEDTDIVDIDKLQDRVKAIGNDTEKRNILLEELLTISDRSCSRHQASIVSTANAWNVSTGTISTLLSAIGTVSGGASDKAALAAGAAFTNSTRSLVNEEVYAKAIGPTIVRATISARDKQLAIIKAGMKEADIKNYSVQQGLRDVYNYHNRCSFYYGLLEITKAIEERKRTKPEIEEKLSLLRSQVKIMKTDGIDTKNIESRIEALVLELEQAPQ